MVFGGELPAFIHNGFKVSQYTIYSIICNALVSLTGN